jgi:uncharacterized protein YukE
MIGRKEDLRKRVDDIDKEIDNLTSNLLDGNAKSQFLDTWNTLKKELDRRQRMC